MACANDGKWEQDGARWLRRTAKDENVDIELEVERLVSDGYIVVTDLLSDLQCDALREHILRTSDEGKAKGRNDLFGNIQEQENRTDLKLDMCQPVLDSINSWGARCGPVLDRILEGTGKLVELAAITSGKGAVAQPVHADTMHGVTRFLQSDVVLPTTTRERTDSSDSEEDENAANDLGKVIQTVATNTSLIFTSLIALQDVDADMGPTHVWPKTHTVEHHATLWNTHIGGKLDVDAADAAFGVQHKKMCLKKGDLVLYDSRVMHCGGANNSEKRRSVFCISCMGDGIRPDGTTWTMLKSFKNKISLDMLPLLQKEVTAKTNTADCAEVELPQCQENFKSRAGDAAKDVEDGPKPIPPVSEWQAAVTCSLCRRWRPCGEAEAPKLSGSENGFSCPMLGFSCMQDQGCTEQEIDALF